MHLRSISIQGFKSFADRTRLDFSPGVSVVVGPNGSGKSNITDAVLWALGEQSPLAVRGQSMQDVIFAGGHGVQARSSAQVEVVLDNSDLDVDIPLSEIAITRYLDRDGDGGYKINGARARLTDVLELLSDTGLGREMHSVISQGRVESIVTSKPKDRRMLIEEAAGLGKHRKRRRRAHLKLERTQTNIERVLDIEREARSRLRPLKRQAEAAELHERLQRQIDESRLTIVRDVVRGARAAVSAAQAEVVSARAAYNESEEQLKAVAAERQAAEEALAGRSREREQLNERYHAARSAADRLELRTDHARDTLTRLDSRIARGEEALATLRAALEGEVEDTGAAERMAALECELSRLAQDRQVALERELVELGERRELAEKHAASCAEAAQERLVARRAAEQAVDEARRVLREAEVGADRARREAAQLGAELAAVNQFLRNHVGAPGGAPALADALQADAGYELALAAALGSSLRAGVAGSIAEATALVERAGRDGGAALVLGGETTDASGSNPPLSGAEQLVKYVRVDGDDRVKQLARLRLANVWVVDSFESLDRAFSGIAVTKSGHTWSPVSRELRRVAPGAEDRVLSERNRRGDLVVKVEAAAQAEQAALKASEVAATNLARATEAHDEVDRATRTATRTSQDAAEAVQHLTRLADQRRNAPDEGPVAERREQTVAALEAERQLVRRAQRERENRVRQATDQQNLLAFQRELRPLVERFLAALEGARAAIATRLEIVAAEIEHDRRASESFAAQLRQCAAKEAQTHAALKERGEAVTRGEVHAQRVRDEGAQAERELGELAEKLGLEAAPAEEALPEEERSDLEKRIERATRRREQLGPVNPLAQQEYTEALDHVEQLERQRTDLETAMRELKSLIRDTDKQIQTAFETTFEAAAKNFAEMVPELFPGGKGALRLVKEEKKVAAAGAASDGPDAAESAEAAEAKAEEAAEAEEAAKEDPLNDDMGVEIELTPAGKTKRSLTLLSGGEKSMTALAFLFAVFLAKPCPFYVLDEVEAALDDLNITRFLKVLKRFADRAQFIVVTHQKRTMEAGDCLYGVSMGSNGVSKVISKKMASIPVEVGEISVERGPGTKVPEPA